jgi:predicted DNA-binding protein (UPF0251 family)
MGFNQRIDCFSPNRTPLASRLRVDVSIEALAAIISLTRLHLLMNQQCLKREGLSKSIIEECPPVRSAVTKGPGLSGAEPSAGVVIA